jgi:hypothetical protein
MNDNFKERYPLEYDRLMLVFWAAIFIFLVPYNQFILIPLLVFFGLLIMPLPTAIITCLGIIISLFWLSF